MSKLVFMNKIWKLIDEGFPYMIAAQEEKLEYLKKETLDMITFPYESEGDTFEERIEAIKRLLEVDRQYKMLHPDADVVGHYSVQEIEELMCYIEAKLAEIDETIDKINLLYLAEPRVLEASQIPDKARDEIFGDVRP